MSAARGLSIGVASLFLIHGHLTAQGEPTPEPVATAATAAWVTAGAGVGSAGPAGLVSFNIRRGVNDFIVRGAGTEEFALFRPPEAAYDAALLFGRHMAEGRAWFRAAVGPGLAVASRPGAQSSSCAWLFCEYETIESKSLGLAFQVEALWAPAKALGLGAAMFGNVNGKAGFAGTALTLSLGRLR